MIDDEDWVGLQVEGMPPPVDRYEYWGEAPPEFSERCIWWLHYLADNDLSLTELCDLTPFAAGYDDSAEAMGVYMWEWLHILYHVVANKKAVRKHYGDVVVPSSPWPLVDGEEESQ